MLNILFTFAIAVILTAAFFILFFDLDLQVMKSKNRTKETKDEESASTTHGFVEDTRDAFIIPMYPSQVMDRDITGKIVPIYGDIGSFVPYSSVSEYNWLHGFPHKKAK
jgi:hypothetical protein